jgi:hypothetical protein
LTNRRIFLCLLATIALLFSTSLSARAQQDNSAETECLKGTVSRVAESALFLKDTSFPDETLGKRDATVRIDKGTAYFDGTKKMNKAALQPGNLVLVRCKMDGKDRVAVLVRVVGGKKQ